MNERKLAEEFERVWEEQSRRGPGSQPGEQPVEVQQALETARLISDLDFSGESQLRESLRRQLQAEYAAGPQPTRRTITWGRLAAGAGSLAGVVVLLACFLFGFSWVIRTVLPGIAPASEGLPVAGLAPTGIPAGTLAVPAAPEIAAPNLTAPTQLAALPVPVLGVESSPDTIRARMQDPAWETVWLQGQVLAPGPGGEPQAVQVEVWLDRQGRGRVITGVAREAPALETPFDPGEQPARAWVSDGQVLESFDLQSGQSEQASLDRGWSPQSFELAAPLLELFNPADLPGSTESLKALADTTWAGRPAVLVSWGGVNYWIDAETGQILRMERLGEDQEVVQEISIDSIVYDLPLTEEALSTENLASVAFQAGVAAATAEPEQPGTRPAPTELPETLPFTYTVQAGDTCRSIAEQTGVPLEVLLSLNDLSADCSDLTIGQVLLLPKPAPTPTPASASSGEPIAITLAGESSSGAAGGGSAGELYFTLRALTAPITRRLARLPLSCLAVEDACEARLLQTGPQVSDNGLHWSPDGSQAALVDFEGRRLWLYDAAGEAWSQLASSLPVTADLVYWSPDGGWIALTAASAGSQDSLITLLAAGDRTYSGRAETFASDLGGTQVPLGWQDENTLVFLRSVTPPKGSSASQEGPQLYRLDARSGEVARLDLGSNPAWLKDLPALSPGGGRLALSLPGADGQLGVYNLESGETSQLGVAGSRPVWSPDGDRIAFLTTPQGDAGPVVEVQVVDEDGSNRSKVFEWNSVPQVLWLPDGEHLLVAASPLGMEPPDDRAPFFLVSLEDGMARQLELQGGRQVFEFIAPAVRPAT